MKKPSTRSPALPILLDTARLAHVIGGQTKTVIFVEHKITSPRDASTGLPTGK